MKRWMLVSRCGTCNEPIPFSPCDFLGYNPGVSGHLFTSKEEAEQALQATRKAIAVFGYEISAETVSRHYLLEGPLMEDGRFWQYTSELTSITHEKPCLIPQKYGFIVHDVTMVDNIFPLEIEFH